jgi:hypothetical protein
MIEELPAELVSANLAPGIRKPNCDFQRDPADPAWIVCRVCKIRRKFAGPIEKYIRTCGARRAEWKPAVEPAPCVHKLEALDVGVPCNVCGMRGQQFTIYACELHGKCMVKRYRNDRPDLTVCDRCPDFAPRA